MSAGYKEQKWRLIQDEMLLQDEPFMKPGLAELPNVVVVPHIASASKVTDLLPVSWGLTSKNFGMYSVGLSTYAYWICHMYVMCLPFDVLSTPDLNPIYWGVESSYKDCPLLEIMEMSVLHHYLFASFYRPPLTHNFCNFPVDKRGHGNSCCIECCCKSSSLESMLYVLILQVLSCRKHFLEALMNLFFNSSHKWSRLNFVSTIYQIQCTFVIDLLKAWLLGYFQGKVKGYPVWSNPNNIAPFLDEHSQPPAACPSIVNAKALGMNTFLPWHCSLPSFTDTVTAGVGPTKSCYQFSITGGCWLICAETWSTWKLWYLQKTWICLMQLTCMRTDKDLNHFSFASECQNKAHFDCVVAFPVSNA